MDRIEKSFTDLDIDAVDFQSGNWSWGCGGHPLRDNEYSISHVSAKLVETRYKLPECINYMLKRQYGFGDSERIGKIKKALGI
jgi:hypothetical protein